MRAGWIAIAFAGIVGAAFTLFVVWPRPLHLRPPTILETTEVSAKGTRVYLPERFLVGQLGEYDNLLFAYLMFDHLRALKELRGMEVLLTSRGQGDATTYPVLVRLPDDLIDGTTLLSKLKSAHVTTDVCYAWVLPSHFYSDSKQSAMFADAYNDPVPNSFQRLGDEEMVAYLGRFMRFKSLTDYRIAHGTDPDLMPLTPEQAKSLAADVVAVSRFFDIPVSMFLGIGAMENNYMNTPGDLEHTVWKRRAEQGDIVLKRQRRRVLVQDDSIGRWQITRKALRHAQQLYRKDKRDYAQLPPWLVPRQRLDWDDLQPKLMTTYAGLLLRELLDHFQGDVEQASGAYNGTLRHPNLRYAAGVQLVAEYAQRVFGHAAELRPLPTAENNPMPLSIGDTMLESIRAENGGPAGMVMGAMFAPEKLLEKSSLEKHVGTSRRIKKRIEN